MESSEALLSGQEISVPIWEFGPQWIKSPKPASRKSSVFWGSLERRTWSSGSRVTAVGPAAVFSTGFSGAQSHSQIRENPVAATAEKTQNAGFFFFISQTPL